MATPLLLGAVIASVSVSKFARYKSVEPSAAGVDIFFTVILEETGVPNGHVAVELKVPVESLTNLVTETSTGGVRFCTTGFRTEGSVGGPSVAGLDPWRSATKGML